jgi:hypothetical protein
MLQHVLLALLGTALKHCTALDKDFFAQTTSRDCSPGVVEPGAAWNMLLRPSTAFGLSVQQAGGAR